MKNPGRITKIVFGIIALAFTLLISQIVPDDQFEPYKLTLDTVWEKEEAQQEYWVDINNDKNLEKIRHHNINIVGHSIEFRRGDKLNQIYIFKGREQFIGKKLTFADVDGNLTKELLFVSVKDSTAYLNILSYDAATKVLLPVDKIVLDTLKRHNEKPDVINNFVLASGGNVYLDLQGGYAVQPRNTYKYNFEHKTISKTKLNSLVTPEMQLFNSQGKCFLLATHVKSTGNTISHQEAEMLKNSTDKDTLQIYNELKHLEYAYGDFSSYILLYNDKLDFAFEPIAFFGWTNFTKTALITIDSIPHIVAFTNAPLDEEDNKRSKLVTICNLQGKVLNQMPLPHDYSDIFTNNKSIVFYADKTLYLKNKQLELLNEIYDITYSYGFTDINQDNEPEFVAYRNNVLTVFSENFDINATFNIEQEFAPYPEKKVISTFIKKGKNLFFYNSRLFYYLFSYKKNSIAFLKYPFYISVFLVLFGILAFIYRLNTKRLEKENQKLEQIVRERTNEIATQKEEIENQAEELRTTNEKLVELDQFKQGLTSMIVHDLKNPLNGILNISKSYSPENQVRQIKQIGHQMLNMVLNILDVNKYQDSQMALNKVALSIYKIAQHAINSMQFLAEQKNINIANNILQEIKVFADFEIIERVFVNMLTNAVKYTPNNGKIKLSAKVEKTQNFVKIIITDTGIGIPQDKIHLVFEKFGQVTAKKTGSIRSTGLGLTFCKIAVESHKGTIDVQSEMEKGTTFYFTLPLAQQKNILEQAPVISSSEKQKICLNTEEKELLMPYIHQLKKTAIYKILELRKILRQINEESDNIKQWKKEIQNAIRSGNQEKYNNLLSI